MSDEYTVKLAEQADTDLFEIGRYISEELKNPQAAFQLTSNITDVLDSLAIFPERHQLSSHKNLGERNIRLVPIKNYVGCIT